MSRRNFFNFTVLDTTVLHKNMEPKKNSLADSKISLQNYNGAEWDTHNAIILKQEIKCDDVELNTEERKPLIINFQTNCDDILNRIPNEPSSEFSEILLENNQRCSIEKRSTVAHRVKKQQSTQSKEKMYQMKLGTCEKLFIYLQRENLEELQKRKYHSEIQRFEDGVASLQPEDTNGLSRINSYQTKSKDQLKMHQQLEQKSTSEVQIYMCDSCPYLTEVKSRLERHLLVHKDPSEVTIYNCGSCSYQTRYKNGLKLHLLQHRSPSEITMFKCDICSFQTKIRHYLKRHAEIHKSESEVKMFKCDSCSYQARRKSLLGLHLLQHKKKTTMYKCKFCSFRTLNRCHFRKHELVVHKEDLDVPTYNCDICSFSTKYKQNLGVHLLLHKSRSEVPT